MPLAATLKIGVARHLPILIRQSASEHQNPIHFNTGGFTMSDIKPHMEIISLCGCLVGTADRVEDGTIKLTRHDCPDGQQYSIPTEWVAWIDECIHLNKDVF